MEFVDFLVNENDHTFRSKNHILQDIFKDWWEPFCQEYKNIRPVDYGRVEMLKTAKGVISNLTTADVVEVKHVKWITHFDDVSRRRIYIFVQ